MGRGGGEKERMCVHVRAREGQRERESVSDLLLVFVHEPMIELPLCGS